MILQGLDPDGHCYSDDFRDVLRFVVLACYDRKVTREAFDEMLIAVNEAHILLSKLEAAVFAGSVFVGLDHEPVRIRAVMVELSKDFRAVRKTLYDKFGLVMQCPLKGTPIS